MQEANASRSQKVMTRNLMLVSVGTMFCAAWAACPFPNPHNHPACLMAEEGELPPELVFDHIDFWPCCDQTHACPINGTEWARFYKYVKVYRVSPGPPTYCVVPYEYSYVNEDDECCGDPLGEPG